MGMGDVQWKISHSSLAQELDVTGRGGRYHLRLSYIPIFANGVLAKIYIIIQDVTEHKRIS